MRPNSYDEWSTLREVIVGSGLNYTTHERELTFDLFLYENIKDDNGNQSDPQLTCGVSVLLTGV